MEATSERRRLALEAPDEILIDIFSRLPTPDLCRCKCVCNYWRRRLIPPLLLSRVAFANIEQMGVWVPRFFSFTSSGFLRDDTPPSLDSIISPPVLKSQVLVGCNGMVMACIGHPQRLFSRSSSPRLGFPDRSKTVGRIVEYLLLNPVTGQTSTIPPPQCSDLNYFFNFLVFDPRVSSEQFIIISIEYLSTSPKPFLYSSQTGEWRRLRASTPAQSISPNRCDCHCVAGIGYKIAGTYTEQGQSTNEYRFGRVIMALDVINECLFSVTSPALLIDDSVGSSSQFIGESAGRLAFAYFDSRNCLSVWMLKDCRTSDWLFTHKVHLNYGQPPRFAGILWSFAFHPVDADLIFVCFSDELFLADLKTMELRDIFLGEKFPAGSLFPYICS